MRTFLTAIAATALTLGLASTEAKAHTEVDVIQSWYLRCLGRPADAVGLSTWVQALHCSATLEEVQAGILASDEYAQEVRERERLYTDAGIHSVPAIVINNQHLISGGQPPEVFERALRQIAGAQAPAVMSA